MEKPIEHPHQDTEPEAIVASTENWLGRSKLQSIVECGSWPSDVEIVGHDWSRTYRPVPCDWDNTEPNHGADPTREYNMVDLTKVVVENGCEMG